MSGAIEARLVYVRSCTFSWAFIACGEQAITNFFSASDPLLTATVLASSDRMRVSCSAIDRPLFTGVGATVVVVAAEVSTGAVSMGMGA